MQFQSSFDRSAFTHYKQTVDLINAFTLNLLPGCIRTYYSSDTITQVTSHISKRDLLYPLQFLNSLKFPSIPHHELNLQVGSVIILLRNIN